MCVWVHVQELWRVRVLYAVRRGWDRGPLPALQAGGDLAGAAPHHLWWVVRLKQSLDLSDSENSGVQEPMHF